jgi:hypothetical protein
MRIAPLMSFVTLSVVSFAADITGTWKMNVAKSKLNADIAGDVMKVEKAGTNTYRFVWDRTSKSGEKTQTTASRICDGKEHVDEASRTPTMYTCDAATLNHVFKRDGKLFTDIDIKFSPDGKTHTATRRRFSPDGRVTGEEVIVMERQ